MKDDMSISTRKKVNKEWGIEEERYARTAPGFTKRKLRKRDTLPIIFVLGMLVVLAIVGWRSSARASGETVLGIDLAGSFQTDNDGIYDEITFGNSVSHVASLFVYDGNEAHIEPVGYTGTITYSSSNTEVATIAADGTITVIKPGTTVITISAPGVQDQFIGCTSSYRLIVDPIPVTISDIVIDKTYDGTTSASIPTRTITYSVDNQIDVLDITINGVLPADSDYVYVLPNVSVSYPNKTAGANKVLEASSFALSGAKANFYELTAQPSVTGTISPKGLTFSSGIVAADKVYDGNAEAELSLSNNTILTSQLISGDTVTFSGTGTFASANASASAQTVTFASGDLVLGGTDAGNYEIATLGQTDATATISKKEITVSGITAEDKAFDDTTSATLVYTNAVLTGKLAGDTLTVSATGAFADKNIGSNKTVTITGMTLSGADAGNYVLASTGQQTSTTATIYSSGISPTVTITGEYTYRGTAITPSYTVKIGDATLRSGTDYTATLSNNINAGTNTGTLVISDVDGGLYQFPDKTVHFTIAKAPATIATVTLGPSLTYNKTEQTQTVTKVSVGGVDLNSSKWDIHGTTNKATDAGNHNLVIDISGDDNVADGSVTKIFTIAPKEVTVTGITAESKTYDGSKNAVLNLANASFSGKLDGDTLTVAQATGEFTSKNAGTGISVSISDIRLGGTSASNYKVSSSSQSSTTASITKADVTPTVSVSGNYVYTGKAIKPTDITVTVSGETLEKTDYSISGYDDNVNAGNATVYVSSKTTGNYNFSSVAGTFTIGKATSLSPSPKTTLSLKSTATAATVGDIAVSSLGVNASKWAWRASDAGKELGSGATGTASTGTTSTAASQPVTVTAVLEYIGDDAANYVDSVRSVTVTITKEGSTAKGTTGTRSTTGTKTTSSKSSTGTASRTGTSSRTSSGTGTTSSKTGTSSRTSGSSSTGTSSRTGSSARTSSGTGTGSAGAAATEAKPPFVEGAPDLSGWETIAEKLLATAIGDSLPVYMNGSSLVPSSLLNGLKGRNVTLVLDMGNSIKWNINGACISQDLNDDLDFAITTNTRNIPTELVDMVSAGDYKMQLHLDHDGDFMVAPILSLNLGANNAGLYANLFYFNESANALEYVTADEISEDGTASLTFTHASDYVIIVDKEILANVAVHLDKPAVETTTIDDSAEKTTDNNLISNIADPNSTQAFVQSQPMEENKTPKSAAVARRIVSPEAKSGLRVFWILLILIAVLVGVNTFLFMNRDELKASASSRASKKALAKSSSRAAAVNGQKNLKKVQKANNKKFKKYL